MPYTDQTSSFTHKFAPISELTSLISTKFYPELLDSATIKYYENTGMPRIPGHIYPWWSAWAPLWPPPAPSPHRTPPETNMPVSSVLRLLMHRFEKHI